ncbi:MAG: SDR family oxidoreductase [Euryarchaeota archaeon]|nr:SDR family oxidoreductase [Euryarchaeota archaeon]
MARVLVAGGAGFIGSHLCERLLEDGNEVVCVDNAHTGDWGNIAHLKGRRGFEELRHDVLKPIDLEAERIFNLACPASPAHYQKDPVYTIRMSTTAVFNLLDLAKETGARFLQASTSEVYGDPLVHPQKEDYWGNVNPVGPRSCYDEGKRLAESLVLGYQQMEGIEVRIARIFNTYGPRMSESDGRVVSNFIVQALRGRGLTVHGDGSQTRSFCYISDMVEGLVRLMDKEGFTGPVNLGNPNEITVLELAERIIRLTRSRSKIAFNSLPKDDPVRRKPDITLARKVLGWEPVVGLDEGLERTIEHFRRTIGSGN